ncbi:MAG TPA: hypothetical protein PKV73_00725 [Agriterribacter sp.]|nr:hypothetical protein [Chitinophagaceae bacterium]HRP30376.1 hypothetical protein [Agriterribacter sp.]
MTIIIVSGKKKKYFKRKAFFMQTQTHISPSEPSVDDKRRHWPAVSIIMPFEPVIQRKDELMQKLNKAMKRVEWEMGTGYDEDLADLVMMKLRMIIQSLNFSTFKKSIAIYVSPVFEKVMYLNMPVNETITVNESFFVRDIVYAKKEIPAFMVLVLSEKRSTLYEGDEVSLTKIKSNGIGNMPDRGYEFPIEENTGDNDALVVQQFLRHTDDGLSIVLAAMPLPVLVLGRKQVLDRFKQVTTNGKDLVECIEYKQGKLTEGQLFDLIQPHIADWEKIKVKHLYRQLEKAATEGKVVNGITAIQKSISHHRGRLLVFGRSLLRNPEILEKKDSESLNVFNKFSCVRHTIDEIIGNVLENGGNIEMVDDDVLGGQHIVLVKDKHDYL